MAGRMSRPHSRTGRQRFWAVFKYPVKTFPGNVPTTTWTTRWSTWVEIGQYSGDEYIFPQQVQDVEEFTIRCRYFEGAQQIERVEITGQGVSAYFHVIQINNIGNLNQELLITAATVDPNQ